MQSSVVVVGTTLRVDRERASCRMCVDDLHLIFSLKANVRPLPFNFLSFPLVGVVFRCSGCKGAGETAVAVLAGWVHAAWPASTPKWQNEGAAAAGGGEGKN